MWAFCKLRPLVAHTCQILPRLESETRSGHVRLKNIEKLTNKTWTDSCFFVFAVFKMLGFHAVLLSSHLAIFRIMAGFDCKWLYSGTCSASSAQQPVPAGVLPALWQSGATVSTPADAISPSLQSFVPSFSLSWCVQAASLSSEEVAGLVAALFEPSPQRAEALRKIRASS